MNDAGLYVTANPMQTKDADESLSQFASNFMWKDSEKILDVGCGPGDVTTKILKKYIPEDAFLVGGDISEDMLNYARSKFASRQIEFKWLDIEGRLEEKNWSSGSFDKIFSFYTFHWIRNQKLALENVFKLLKSGGQLFLVFMAKVPIFELYRRLSAGDQWAPYMMDVDNYVCKYHDMIDPEEEVRKSMMEVKFRNVQVICKQKSFVYSSLEQLTQCVLAVNPFVKRVPAHLLSSYKEDIARHSHEMSSPKGDGIEVKYSLIIVYAEK